MCIVSGDGTALERQAVACSETVALGCGSGLREVWLLDTGAFVILDDLPEAWREDVTYMLGLRQRRTLRMMLPATEVSKLPGVAQALKIAARALEIRDSLESVDARRQADREDGFLLAIAVNHDETDREAQAALIRHLGDAFQVFNTALDGILAQVRLLPRTATVRAVPFRRRRVPFPTPEERARMAKAAKISAA